MYTKRHTDILARFTCKYKTVPSNQNQDKTKTAVWDSVWPLAVILYLLVYEAFLNHSEPESSSVTFSESHVSQSRHRSHYLTALCLCVKHATPQILHDSLHGNICEKRNVSVCPCSVVNWSYNTDLSICPMPCFSHVLIGFTVVNTSRTDLYLEPGLSSWFSLRFSQI